MSLPNNTPTPTSFTTPQWWKDSTIYQIYPASFLSTSSGSIPGWGDIPGITSKLSYLQHLGVDILWLSPIYASPQVDMGYDISDYTSIDPRYGKLEDVDRLIREAGERGMKVMMDLVVNHTSDQHSWFQESRSSKEAGRRGWYHWQPPKCDEDTGERRPPNNWAQILGEANSAWTWDEESQEYYLSLFTPEQPDLNWRNPEVEGYPDAEVVDPEAPFQPGWELYANGPELHTYLKEIYEKVLSKYDTITVGEMPFVNDEKEILKVVASDRKELNMIFIFDLVEIDSAEFRFTLRDWKMSEFRNAISRWQTIMREGGGWNSVFIENHDNPRSVSRYCDDSTPESRERGERLLALMQATLGGKLYIFQGEELGQRNYPMSWGVEKYKDIESQNYWAKMKKLYPDDPEKLQEARTVMQRKARDHSRTPVQWYGEGKNAGFCDETVEPWMRVNDDYTTVNAEAQLKFAEPEKLSVLQFWQRCLQRRKERKEIFIYGTFAELDAGGEESPVFAYTMTSAQVSHPAAAVDGHSGQAAVVVLNFSGNEVDWALPEEVKVGAWVMGNYDAWGPERAGEEIVKLRAWEGILGMVDG